MTRWFLTPDARAKAKDEADAIIRRRKAELEDVGLDVDLDVRWGDLTTEIIKEAKNSSSDVVLLEATQQSVFQTILAGDYQRDVLTRCPTSVFVARPEGTASRSVIVLMDSHKNFSKAINKVWNLQLPAETGIYLTSFVDPVKLSAGMLITFREYLRERDEARNRAKIAMATLYLESQAHRLADAGYSPEVIVREQDLLEGLTDLVEEVAAGLVIVPDTRLPSRDRESTRRATRIAQHLPCSVLVAR